VEEAEPTAAGTEPTAEEAEPAAGTAGADRAPAWSPPTRIPPAPPTRPAPWTPIEPAAPPAPPAAAAAASAKPAEPAAAAGPDAPRAVRESGLPGVAAIVRRELGVLFASPLAYVLGAVVVLLTSVFGYLSQIVGGQPLAMAAVFNSVALMMAVLTPLVTVRLLADERRTERARPPAAPAGARELVAGKWLAGLVFYLAAIAFTLGYVVLIAVYQRQPPLDYGAIVAAYLGAALVGATWVALGLVASSLARNRLVAVLAGMAVLVTLQYVLGTLAGLLAPPLSDLLEYVSAADRARSFDQGQVALRDVVYFVTLTLGALFLATRAVEATRSR